MGKQITYHVFMDSKDIQKILGNSLKELREAKGLTQEKLGERIGVEAGTIYRLEAGKNFIKSETLAKLCDALDVHPSLFFTARPTITLDNHADSIKNITRFFNEMYGWLGFSQDKLNDAYNILKVLHK
jgi:transcriptional regulator with XRE-family HTH domain